MGSNSSHTLSRAPRYSTSGLILHLLHNTNHIVFSSHNISKAHYIGCLTGTNQAAMPIFCYSIQEELVLNTAAQRKYGRQEPSPC